MRSRFISQIYIHGDSIRDSLVALVVLDEDTIKQWCREINNNDSMFVLFETKSKYWQIVFDDMIRLGREHHLMPYEQVKTMAILKEPFTIENELLTATFKLRRKAIEKKYNNLIQDLFKSMQLKTL